MARLIVENFSCIKDVDIEISNLTILIGGQASGKSLLGKLVWFFCKAIDYYFSTEYFHNLRGNGGYEEEKNFTASYASDEASAQICYLFGSLFVLRDNQQNDFTISFEYQNITMLINGTKNAGGGGISTGFNFTVSPKAFNLLEDYTENLKKRWSYQSEHKIYDEMNVPKPIASDSMFVPTGRFLFLGDLMSASIFKSRNTEKTLIDFGMRFADLKDGYRNGYGFNSLFRNQSFLERNKELTIKGDITQEGGKFFVSSADGRKIPINRASSGQQELFPLLLSFDYIQDEKIDFSIIEEPEAHLFPDTQGMITKFIAELAMMRYADAPEHINHMFITTHSPYILSQVNNLLEAGRLAKQYAGNEEKLAQIHEIVEREYWLDEENVRVYSLEKGKARSVIENGVINGAYLDSLSDAIMDDYEALMRLSLQEEEE